MEKTFWPAFKWMQHLKAGRNSQQLPAIVFVLHSNILFCSKNLFLMFSKKLISWMHFIYSPSNMVRRFFITSLVNYFYFRNWLNIKVKEYKSRNKIATFKNQKTADELTFNKFILDLGNYLTSQPPVLVM